MSAEPIARVVIDTNVLLAATDRSRASHAAATGFLNEDERRLALTPQVVREYLAVATRPVSMNGFGLASTEAAANIQQCLEDMELLAEDLVATQLLLRLVAEGPAVGKQVHDANIVAVALAHQASAIVTDNTRHFARFVRMIPVEELRSRPLH